MCTQKYDTEASLPQYLQSSLEQYKKAYSRHMHDKEYTAFDCDYMEFQSDINVMETNGEISEETAWFLRQKYLGMERNGI